MTENVFDEYVERVSVILKPLVTPELFAEVLRIFARWAEVFNATKRGEFIPTLEPANIDRQTLELTNPERPLIKCSLNTVNDYGKTVSAYSFTLNLDRQAIVEGHLIDVYGLPIKRVTIKRFNT